MAPSSRVIAAVLAAAALSLLASSCASEPDLSPQPATTAAEPEVTEPETSEPETSEPETSEPETSEPETSEPETSEPETSEPETSEPETSEPETSEPETSETSEPETSEPETSEPETSEPEVAEPEVAEPEPEVTEPEVTEPEVAEPETSEPEVAEPEPEVTEPEVAEPETSEPEPEVTEPETSAPETSEPEPEVTEPVVVEPVVVEPVVDDPVVEPVVVDPVVVAPVVAWVEPYAGYVPEVHPDTPSLSWGLGHDAPTPEGLPALVPAPAGGDMPRPTPGVVEWSRWCVANTISGQCARALHQSVWALDYLGASESCVIEQMTRQVNGFVRWETPVSDSDSGWFRCPTVILPDPAGDGDAPLLVQSLADRCREVLPPDVDLVSYRLLVGGLDPSQATAEEIEAAIGADPAQMTPGELREHFEYVPVLGASCDEWAQTETTGSVPEYFSLRHTAKLLVVEWMQHHYGAPPRGEWGVA